MRSLLLIGASLAAITSAPLFAQTAAAAEGENSDEYIVVTGSRIARPNVDSAVPISTVTAVELQRTGEVNLGDTINLLPQFRPTFSSQNSGRFIGTAGINALDLRGQGTARTLVLQNGRRHVSSQPGQQTVDVNTIPTELVERVDIITGGNSALYGSDAVAGVVNFVMKRDFEGIEVRGQTGLSDRFDRGNYYVTLTAGKNFADGRGNVAVNVGVSSSPPLFFSDRDGQTGAFSGRRQFQLTENTTFSGPNNTTEPAAGNGIFDTTLLSGIKNAGISTGGAITSACTGAPARRALNCSGVLSPTSRNADGTLNFTELGNIFVFQPDGTLVRNVGSRDFRPFGSGNFVGGLGSTLRETGLLQVGQTNYTGNLLASYEVSDAARFFFEGKFVRTESIQEGQPTFSSGALNPTFSINNPFLTQQARDLLVQSLAPGATGFTFQRFNIDFGGRGENHTRDLYRIVAGVEGNFLDTWRYEVSLNYGHVDTYYQTRGNVNLANFTRAVNAVRNTSGQIVCAVNADTNPANDDPACRPLNLFGLGAPSPEALNYIIFDSSRKQWAEQFNAVAFVNGDSGKWFELPGGPVGFVLGGEYRQENSFSAFDPFTAGGGTFLNAIAPFTPPKLEIWEGFGEIRVPILADMPFFHELTLEGAARVSNYNVGNTGTVWAYNLGGVWAPVPDVRFRASYAKAVRAPTQSDLFNSASQTFLNGLVDPCGQQNINANPNRVANCAAAGVPTTQTFTVGGTTTTEPFTNRPASGILGLSAGNSGLEEERSTSWTLGAVIQPRWTPGLVFSVDYYDIEIKNVINTVAAQTVINQCYDDPGGINNQFCRAITRNPNGTFAGQQNVLHGGGQAEFPLTGTSFLQGPFNYARQTTRGIDFDLAYTYPSQGDWRLSGRATVAWLLNRDIYTAITEPDRLTRIKGTLGDPEWNGRLNVTVGYKAIDFGWTLRYIDKMTTAANWRNQFSEQGRPPENADQNPELWYPTYTYHDIRLDAKIGPKLDMYIGIDNLFDALPPYDLLGTEAGAPYTNTGRFMYAGFRARF
jgi:outer membrane receptor protein involved in Fe transport